MNEWVKELPAEITVCTAGGTIVELNACAVELFQEDGGRQLLGTNLLDCHLEPARAKLAGMLEKPVPNPYFETEKGEKRFFYQSPWFQNGEYAGFVEISFPVSGQLPHFKRG
jgi:hypothetical protein